MNNFNSRETYLDARKAWKENYARLTIESREARSAYHDAQRELAKAPYDYRLNYNENTANRIAAKNVFEAMKARWDIRGQANAALADLGLMKAEAAKQWQAAHAMA